MIRTRVRIRFIKEGDLRLISHRDLLRTFERLFRRADLKLSMSEGFHPKPRMSFPSALALGIRGNEEVMELDLAEQFDAKHLASLLATHAPPGLSIRKLEVLPAGTKKARICRVGYEIPVPAECEDELESARQSLLASSSRVVTRPGKAKPVDVRAGLEELVLEAGTLRMKLRASEQGAAGPRHVLQSLGFPHLEGDGRYLTRTLVELQS